MSKSNKGSGNAGRNEPWNKAEPSGASDGDIQRVHDELVHQKESPREGFSPIPIFLVFLISGLIVFSGIYVVWRSDDFDQMGYDETRRTWPWADDMAPLAAVDPRIQAGQRLYGQCAACHQQNGQGVPGAFPPLEGTRWVLGSEERLIRIVAHGLAGEIEVKGTTYGEAMVMPAFPQFSDEEMASVLTYIRQAWSNEAPSINADTVAAVRAEVGPRPRAWSAEEILEQFPLEDPAELEAELSEAESEEVGSDGDEAEG